MGQIPVIHLMINFSMIKLHLLLFSLDVHDVFEGEGHEEVAFTLVELGHELHPVKTQGVEEGGEALHEEQHPDGEHGPRHEHDKHTGHPEVAVQLQPDTEQHGPQHLRQLSVSKTEGPQS